MRLIDADALKEKLQARYDNGEEDFDKGYNIGIETAIDLLDNAPAVETNEMTQDLIDKVNVNVGLAQPIKDERPQGEFTRGELENWLYAIAINNTDNDLGKNCEEIIKRLDGFVRYVEFIRSEHDGT